MAWSDAARAAAAAARKAKARQTTYEPPKDGAHISRKEMAKWVREARSSGSRGPGKMVEAVTRATEGFRGQRAYYTNVKGAHFVDQGLSGKIWRSTRQRAPAGKVLGAPRGGAPKWAGSQVAYTKSVYKRY